MKIGAVIAEYNPFHSGHAYQIETYKNMHHPDAVIAIMSEDFVQRGEPACMIYEDRVRAALACGVDIVIGLPVWFSTASAGVFAAGSISLLNACGCIDDLFFGCDSSHSPNFLYEEMSKAASIINEEPILYKKTLNFHLHTGAHFAIARSKALQACGLDSTIYDSPNNILGLAYITALKNTNSSIQPLIIPRIGNGYHDLSTIGHFLSASAIRKNWCSSKKPNNPKILSGIPKQAMDIYLSCYNKRMPVELKDFDALFAMAIHEHSAELKKYADMSSDLSNRINKYQNQYISLNNFINTISNRSLTESRVKRACLHTMLNLDQAMCASSKVSQNTAYLRILGFRKSAAGVLKEISRHATVPIVTKPSDYQSNLPKEACRLFEKDLNASLLYRTAARIKFKTSDIPHPFSSGVIIHRDV